MTMKRTLSILLVLALTLSLAACGSSPGDDLQSPTSVNPGNNSQQPSTNTPAAEATIKETVLLDESGIKITAKSLSTDGLFGPELKLLIENNSGKDLTIQGRGVSVNGYMVDTMMSVEVVNGKKANDSLTILKADLESCGIETIADLEFSFHIFTTSDWETYLDTPKIQLKTSAAETYAYTFDDSGDVAYEGNGLKIVVKGLSKDDSLLGPGIIVYIANSSDKDLTVQTRDISINGFMVDAMFSPEVMAGKHAVDTITFLSTDLEENDITTIQTVELSFHVFETASWDTVVDTEVVTINF